MANRQLRTMRKGGARKAAVITAAALTLSSGKAAIAEEGLNAPSAELDIIT